MCARSLSSEVYNRMGHCLPLSLSQVAHTLAILLLDSGAKARQAHRLGIHYHVIIVVVCSYRGS